MNGSEDTRRHVEDLRGLGRLAVEATKGVTDVVQEVQGAIGGAPARFFFRPVYAVIRLVTSFAGIKLDSALARLERVLGQGTPGPEREALLAALNGVLGDYLVETGNPLALKMRLGRADAGPAGPRLLVLVHGSSMSRHGWQVARDLGYTLLHLDYNSGLHVSTNGRAFDALLEEAVAGWPVPVEEIAIVAHSMGGLVARSACRYAEEAGHAWRKRLRSIVFLATPHHGAPLERGGNLLETLLGVTPHSAPFARLGRIRSAGITDLRYGNLLDEDWQGRGRFERGQDTRTPVPLPEGVLCYAIAGGSDGLVPVVSAMGDHPDPARALGIPATHRLVVPGMGHVALLRDAGVWDRVESWLGEARLHMT